MDKQAIDIIHNLVEKIKELEAINRSLESRLNYIQNGKGEAFIPPENSTNRGED